MKTYEGWHESRMGLGQYLTVGDQVDEAIADYFLNVLPPVTWNSTLIQIGEPYNHIGSRATYPTLRRESGNWYYAGNCFKGESKQD